MSNPDLLPKIAKRKRFHFAKYVNYDKERNISECLVCRKQLKSLSTGNIKRHYLKLHNRNLDYDADCRIRSIPIRKVCKFKPSMTMNKSDFLMCCVGLVALRNIPISLFDDEDYFKKLLLPFEEEYKLTVNAESVKTYLKSSVSELRNIIAEELRAKLVCLKFEVVTSGERGFLVMNVQYIEEFKIVTQTIGVVEMMKDHEMDLPQILRNLNECGLDNSLIYVSCSDSCVNVKNLEFLENENVINDDEWNEEYENVHTSLTDVVRSPSQTLHLAAQAVIEGLASKIEQCRKNVIDLSLINRDSTEKTQMKIALDIPTRWLTTYNMIDTLSKMKTFVESYKKPIKVDWKFVAQFSAAFKPLADCVEKLNNANYIIGDFYRDCLCCDIELETLAESNIYAALLYKEFKAGREKLLENGTFLAALYVDQRFNFIKTPFLTEEQQHFALESLLTTVASLHRPTIKDEYSSDEGERSMDVTIENDPFIKLEERTKSLIGSQTTSKGKTIKEKLESLQFGERLSFHVDILNHWKCLTNEDFEMRELIEVVLAAPCTQSSLKMAMKELMNILQQPESNELSNKAISDILMVKLNSNILNFISLDVKNNDAVGEISLSSL